MIISFWSDTWNQIERVFTTVKDWIFNNYNNPLLWGGLFLIILVITLLAFNSLNKDNF